jgi:hypothetical protein
MESQERRISMAQIIPSAYMNFRRFLNLREKFGANAAVKQLKREQLEDVLNFVVSCGEQQAYVDAADCIAISNKVDFQPSSQAKRADEETPR